MTDIIFIGDMGRSEEAPLPHLQWRHPSPLSQAVAPTFCHSTLHTAWTLTKGNVEPNSPLHSNTGARAGPAPAQQIQARAR